MLKSTDYRSKLEMANYYFQKKDYFRANSLYEQLEDVFGGTPTAEIVLYNSSQCDFGLKQYALAGFKFKTYFENYPTGEHAEEALYMTAYCQFLESQEPELDQTDTYKAIETFRIFFNVYPESKYVPECNTMLDKLRNKLSFKAYRIARLYYDMADYKSAIVALNNVVKDFPEIAQKEEIDFLYLKSHFLLAQNSVQEKQTERYNTTLEVYEEFSELYTEGSRYMTEAKLIKEKSKQALIKLTEKI